MAKETDFGTAMGKVMTCMADKTVWEKFMGVGCPLPASGDVCPKKCTATLTKGDMADIAKTDCDTLTDDEVKLVNAAKAKVKAMNGKAATENGAGSMASIFIALVVGLFFAL